MIVALWTALISATAGVVVLIVRRRNIRIGKLLFSASVLFLVVGTILGIAESYELKRHIAERHWPITNGVIVKSEIVGERAYVPWITYAYEVNAKKYTGATDLDAPGFGNKYVRLEVADAMASEYPVGKTLVVRYDSLNPQVSLLKPNAPWNVYAGLSLSVILVILGTSGVVAFHLRGRQS